MPLLLLVLFIGVPVLEIYVIVQVGLAIGVIPTVVLLLLDGFLGSWLVRREGRRAWEALRAAAAAGRVPAREAADGALVLVGGALLLAPGFVTDVVGLVCILPVTRPLLRGALWRFLTGRVVVVGRFPGRGPVARGTVVDGTVVDGTVVDGTVVDGTVVDGEVVDGDGDGRPPR